MDEIGGYFELETNNFNSVYHDNAVALNSGRNALEYILLVNDYTKIYLPYYTCDVILQPIKKLNINFEFYYLDRNFLPKIDSIKDSEVLLYVNYFGIMQNNFTFLKNKYKILIVDNSQAFFAKPVEGIPTFYSPRKFFGVPDGGFVYCKEHTNIDLKVDKSGDRISHLISRVENDPESGYEFFKQNDNKLNNCPLRKMSKLTHKILSSINYEAVCEKRNKNFNFLHHYLKDRNELTKILKNNKVNGQMIYPFLCLGNEKLRDTLIKEKIFVAKYWPNVIDWIDNDNVYEKHLYNNLLAIPIDQRYSIEDMKKILTYV